jgi:hypothetical protein
MIDNHSPNQITHKLLLYEMRMCVSFVNVEMNFWVKVKLSYV